MDPAETELDLGTPERNALHNRLLACGAASLAEAYEGIVCLVQQPGFPARRHLIAHLVRDIANGLPEVVTGKRVARFEEKKALDKLAPAWRREVPSPAKFAEPGQTADGTTTLTISAALGDQVSRLVQDHERVRQTRHDKHALLMDALRPGSLGLNRALEPVIRDWIKEVDWFEKRAHVPRTAAARPPDDKDDRELEGHWRAFEDGLRGLLAGHFEVTRELGTLLESSPPESATLRRALPLLGGAEQLRYFFQHAQVQDPRWVPVLEEAGFFKDAPEPIPDTEQGTVAYWNWPASGYLARMAEHAEAQETVAGIAAQITTANAPVQDDLAQVALALPPHLAVKLADTVSRALGGRGGRSLLLDKHAAALTEKLARAGESRAGRRLLTALFEVLPDPDDTSTSPLPPTPRTRVEHHSLERLFGPHLKGLVAALGLAALDAPRDALVQAMRLSGRSDPNETIEDHSYIWRPRIASDNRQDARDVLVTIVRRTAEQVAAADTSLIPMLLERLEKCRWLIFRRLALHVLTWLDAPPPELVATRLLDRTLFDHFETCPEYRNLLERHFALLDHEQQETLLGWIDAALPAEVVCASHERWFGQTPDEAQVSAEQRRWRWARLHLIQDALPAGWAKRTAALAREFGPPEPSVRAEPRAHFGAIGWQSPLTTEEVRSMSVTELAAYLRAWRPPVDQPFVCARGLGEAITAAVERSPLHYASEATAFRGLRPTYVKAVLHGLTRAVREKRSFAWDGVLALAEWVLQHTVDEPEPEGIDREDPGWGWARAAVLALLDQALRAERGPLPADARSRVWGLLETLCGDPNPQRRGDALEAAVRYATWARIQAGGAWNGAGTFDDVPEVRTAFDTALDPDVSPSPPVHEAVGHELPWLIFMDEAWVRSRLTRIFPADQAPGELWRATWQGYIHSGAPLHDRVFAALLPVYRQAVEHLSSTREAGDEDRLEPAEEHLAQHLMIFYGRGTLETKGASALITRFLERASLRLRRHCLWYVGYSLREDKEPVAPEVLERFQALWSARREAASKDPVLREELPAFGMWFACELFDEAWRLEQLECVLREADRVDHDHLVVEELGRMVAGHTAAAMHCFGLLVGRLRESAPTFGWHDATKTILAAALRSDDPTVQGEAIQAFHHLGSLGLGKDELLPFSKDLDDPAAIPYFTWDHPMTVAEIYHRLTDASEPERDRLLGQILREAKDTDVWKFTTPDEVVRSWPRIERHLGKSRSFWESLLGQWKEQGLLAG